jgi:peroxiredoxin
MLPYLSRLAAVVLFVSAPAFAEPHTVPIPEFLAPMLSQMNIETVASITYQDEKGQQIDEAAFAELYKKTKTFSMTKKPNKDGLPEVTLRVKANQPVASGFAKLKVGDQFPKFRLARMDGAMVDNKALEGRYTLVSFYFAECGPCIKEVPQLNALAERRKDVNLLAITFDPAKETKEFVAKHGLTWPIVADARKLMNEIGVKAYPTMALLDPQGKLVEVMEGNVRLQDPAVFDAWLDKKLGVVAPSSAAAGVQVPPALAPLFQQMKLESVASISYLDEAGKPIDADAFIGKIRANGHFGISKKPGSADALPDVVLRLQTKDEAEGKFTKLKQGQAFPQFHLTRLDKAAVDNRVFEGKYTLVSFYFAECGPCVREVPLLNALAERRKDVTLLAITFDSAKETSQFVAKHGLAWPVVTDAKGLTDAIGVRAYPTMALIDPMGKLVEVTTGSALLENAAAFDAWLNKRMVTAN